MLAFDKNKKMWYSNNDKIFLKAKRNKMALDKRRKV